MWRIYFFCNKKTLQEVANDLDIDVRTLRAGLEQGVFPFGVAIQRNRMTYHIWKDKYEAWKEVTNETNENISRL